MQRFLITATFIAFATFAGATFAGTGHTLSRNIVIDASADQVWHLLRQIDGVERYSGGMVTHSALKGEPGVGCERVCKLNNGMEVTEKVVAFDDQARTYSYKVTGAPFPVTTMVNSARVVDLGYNRSLLVWTSNYTPGPQGDPQEIAMMLGGVLEMVTMEVKKLMESNAS